MASPESKEKEAEKPDKDVKSYAVEGLPPNKSEKEQEKEP